MILSRKEFGRKYNAAYRAVAGKPASNHLLQRHYDSYKALCNLTGNSGGEILFAQRPRLDAEGNLPWQFKPAADGVHL